MQTWGVPSNISGRHSVWNFLPCRIYLAHWVVKQLSNVHWTAVQFSGTDICWDHRLFIMGIKCKGCVQKNSNFTQRYDYIALTTQSRDKASIIINRNLPLPYSTVSCLWPWLIPNAFQWIFSTIPISWTSETRNFKFHTQIGHGKQW